VPVDGHGRMRNAMNGNERPMAPRGRAARSRSHMAARGRPIEA
jgi:hypothetical protein